MSGILDGLRARLPIRRPEPRIDARPQDRDSDRAGPSAAELQDLAALGIYAGPLPGDPAPASQFKTVEVVDRGAPGSIEDVALGRPDSIARQEARGDRSPSTPGTWRRGSRRFTEGTAEAADRIRIVELGEAAGWPRLEYRQGSAIGAGEAAWRRFAGRDGLESGDLTAIAAAFGDV